MAVDLEDRIESWNSQMEVMFALPRARSVEPAMSAVLPAGFLEEYYRVRQTQGIHNLYKFRLSTTAGEYAHRQHRHRSAGQQRLQRDRPADHC